MQKHDKEFFINDAEEKYEMYKLSFNGLIEERNRMSEDEFLNNLSTCVHLIRYYGDLLDILKE
jgi:hypothetical protein